MMPFVITAFIALLFLLLLVASSRYHRPLPKDASRPTGEGEATHPGRSAGSGSVRPAAQAAHDEPGPNWWERTLGFQRSIGLLLTVGGVWHTASPWINRYSDVAAATASNVVSGLALAAVGVAFVVVRGGTWLTWAAGLLGVWVLVAPPILGFGGPGLAANEAVWGGPITIALAVLAGLERRLGALTAHAPQ